MTYEIRFNDASDNMGCLDSPLVKTITGINTDRVRVDLIDGAGREEFESLMTQDELIRSYTHLHRIIATWNASQDPATEAPIRLRWDGDTWSDPTMADFARINTATQSDPYIDGETVEFGYEVR